MIDVSGPPKRLPDMTVIVSGGKIVAVGKADDVPIPEGALVVDGTGRYLIPGLWDMHAHVTSEALLPLFLGNGVTGVRHMFAASPIFRVKDVRDEIAAGKRSGPRMVAADYLLDGPQPALPLALHWHIYAVGTPKEAVVAVGKIHRAGVDFLKVYSLLPRDAYLAIAKEARKRKLPLAGHLPHAVTAAEASDAGQNSIEHLCGVALACAADEKELRKELDLMLRDPKADVVDRASAWRFQVRAHRKYDPKKAAPLFAKFVRNQTWHVPTLVQTRAWASLDNKLFLADERVTRMPKAERFFWKVEKTDRGVLLPNLGLFLPNADLQDRKFLFRQDVKLVGEMHRAGVPLLAGTDCPNPYCFPGSGLHDELALLCDAGLTPGEALRCATWNPAKFLGREKQLGSVAPGKIADLVLLDADPLEKIANTRRIAGVVAAGRYYAGEELRKMAGGKP